jgi:hypothetical protein
MKPKSQYNREGGSSNTHYSSGNMMGQQNTNYTDYTQNRPPYLESASSPELDREIYRKFSGF